MGVRIIKHAVVHNSSDPEDFLRRVKENIQDLTAKYPDIDPHIITLAAVGYPSSPDAFLASVRKRKAEKRPDAPRVDIGIGGKYSEFWQIIKEKNLKSEVLRRRLLTPDQLTMLENHFEGGSKVKKIPPEVLCKLTIAVAWLS